MTVTLGLSSMKIGAFESRVTATPILAQSWVRIRPFCRLCPFTSASEARMRCVSSRWPISSENRRAGRCDVQADVGQHAEGEAGLSHARAGAHDVQRRGLEAEEDLVQLVVAGGHTRDLRAALAQLLNAVQPLTEERLQRAHGVDRPALADVEHHLLRLVDRRLDVLGHGVADVGDVPGDADELAQQRVLLDDLGVVPRVGDRGRVGQQRNEDGAVADRLEHPRALQLVGHRHRVDGLAPLHERLDGAEDVPVRRLVEVGRRALLYPDRRRVVGEEHGPEQRLLRLHVMGRHPRAARQRGGGRPQRTGAGVVKGLDHGSLTLPVGVWGT